MYMFWKIRIWWRKWSDSSHQFTTVSILFQSQLFITQTTSTLCKLLRVKYPSEFHVIVPRAVDFDINNFILWYPVMIWTHRSVIERTGWKFWKRSHNRIRHSGGLVNVWMMHHGSCDCHLSGISGNRWNVRLSLKSVHVLEIYVRVSERIAHIFALHYWTIMHTC